MGWLLAGLVALFALLAGGGTATPATPAKLPRKRPSGNLPAPPLTGDAEELPDIAPETDFGPDVVASYGDLRAGMAVRDLDVTAAYLSDYTTLRSEITEAGWYADGQLAGLPAVSDEGEATEYLQPWYDAANALVARRSGYLQRLVALAVAASESTNAAELRTWANEAASYGQRGRSVAAEIRAKADAVVAALGP